MHRLKTFLRSRPVFVFLLPLFFVLHGCVEHFDFIPLPDALLLTAIYFFASIVIFLLSWLFYRDWIKAGLLTFFIMAFHFFFGGFHDRLKKLFPETFITRYIFILPLSFIVFILIVFLLKKTRRSFIKLSAYLNIVLALLIPIDLGVLLSKLLFQKKESFNLSNEFTKCDSCKKPDVYFIIADEYAGHDELKDIFHYDNSDFENELGKRGFHIIDKSFSNYNYTPFSIASILNMKYLQLRDTNRTGKDITYSYQQIKNNKVKSFFEANGYKFYNCSIFDFEGQPARVRENFLPAKTKLITSQTFLSRLERDLWFNLVTRLKSKRSIRKTTYSYRNNNDHIYQLTSDVVQQASTGPRLVYTHLMMPHYPYYYDEDGNELPFERLTEGNQEHKDDYIGYLQYSNQKFLDLVDHIQRSSPEPPIIILMGDHGFRHFNEPVERKYFFMNFTSVYFPDKNYSLLTDSTSSVNLFRQILNSRFAQQLPLLKDSSVYLRD
jgi:hypothetical protein